jgi:hypothetical protein
MADSPTWRQAFNSVERRISPPISSVTSSADFQVAAHKLHQARQAVVRPIGNLASWGLHLAGLPSHADVRGLKQQLGELQRELLTLRREVRESESDHGEQP